MDGSFTIFWKEETKLNLKEFKKLIEFEKNEIQILKSWLWNNERIISGLKSLRVLNETYENKILPAIENIHPELLSNREITEKEFSDSFKTKDFPIGTSGDLSSVVYTNER